MPFREIYFDQSGDAYDELQAAGAEQFLNTLQGAVDFRAGLMTPTPPWGGSDKLELAMHVDGVGDVRVHVNHSLASVGISAEVPHGT